MIRFTLTQLNEKSEHRPQGYRAEVLERSRLIAPELYEMDESVFTELADKYRQPNFFEKVVNASEAVMVAFTDPRMRSKKEVKEVTDICRVCPFVVESTFSCGVCGCSLYVKPLAKSWHCPQKKW